MIFVNFSSIFFLFRIEIVPFPGQTYLAATQFSSFFFIYDEMIWSFRLGRSDSVDELVRIFECLIHSIGHTLVNEETVSLSLAIYSFIDS